MDTGDICERLQLTANHATHLIKRVQTGDVAAPIKCPAHRRLLTYIYWTAIEEAYEEIVMQGKAGCWDEVDSSLRYLNRTITDLKNL